MPALAFLDESGDAGMALQSGSSAFFTVAAVLFESGESATECGHSVERLRTRLHLSPRAELKFHSDSHERRLIVLEHLSGLGLHVTSLTVDKSALAGRGIRQNGHDLYTSVCARVVASVVERVGPAKVVLDGKTSRLFRQAMAQQLRPDAGSMQLALRRSQSEPLLQAADYFAGVANRAASRKPGAIEYLKRVERCFVERTVLG